MLTFVTHLSVDDGHEEVVDDEGLRHPQIMREEESREGKDQILGWGVGVDAPVQILATNEILVSF